MPKDEYIRFRCEGDLKQRFERIAAVLRRDESDLGRIIFEDFVAEQERTLGLTSSSYALKETATTYRAPRVNSAAKPHRSLLGADDPSVPAGLRALRKPQPRATVARAKRKSGSIPSVKPAATKQ